MELKAFIDVMNRLAPPETALSFDNCGLIVGTEKTDIRRVLVALDCTTAVADESARVNADLVLTHHPVLFNAVKRILPDDPETAAVYKLIRSGIGCMAAHTNLDAAEGGVNTELCRIFGLKTRSSFRRRTSCAWASLKRRCSSISLQRPLRWLLLLRSTGSWARGLQ